MRKPLAVIATLVLAASLCLVEPVRPVHTAPDAATTGAPGYSKQLGAFFVEVLPQYQLMEGLFTQSIWAEPLHLADNKNDYLADLSVFMSPYRDHAAVRLMNELSRRLGAISFAAYALYLGPLPDLEVVHDVPEQYYDMAGGKEKMEEFRLAMKALADESDFLEFVLRWQPHCEVWTEQALEGTDLARVQEWMGEFYGQSALEFHLVLSPALLGVYFGPSIADKENRLIPYLVLSCAAGNAEEPLFPAGDRLESVALHELGHSFVNPALDPYAERIDRYPALIPDVQEKMTAQGNPPLIRAFVIENVLRAVTSLAEGEIHGARARASGIAAHKNAGYYLVGRLARDLDEYADNRDRYQTFADFVPTLLDKIETYRTMEGARWRLWVMENWRTPSIVGLGIVLLILTVKVQSRWSASK